MRLRPSQPAADELLLHDLAAFTRQVGAMLDIGVDVLRALRVASRYCGKEPLIAATDDIIRVLEDGRELHQALQQHPELFEPFYIEMARQGESDGVLGRALLAVADYLDRLAEASPDGRLRGAPPARRRERLGPAGLIGVTLLGAGAIWSGFAAVGEAAAPWLAPALLLWCGAALFTGRRQWLPGAGPPPTPPAPSSRRRAEEAAGLARSVRMELDDEEAGAIAPGPFNPGAGEFPAPQP